MARVTLSHLEKREFLLLIESQKIKTLRRGSYSIDFPFTFF